MAPAGLLSRTPSSASTTTLTMTRPRPAFVKDTVRIPSVTTGWELDAWRFLPTERSLSPRLPVVVMAHGLGANKRLGLEPYARAFAEAGYAVLLFDYRRWGESDGTPRNMLFVSDQLEDYRTVVRWARKQDEFDPARVVVWGTSFAGGHAISLAAESRLKLAGAIAQCPYAGGPPLVWGTGLLLTIMYALLDVVTQAFGRGPIYVPTCAEPGNVGVMTVPRWARDMWALAEDKHDFPNTISASSMLEVPLYSPKSGARDTSCPLLVIPPARDRLCTPRDARAIRAAAPRGLVTLKPVPGDHFDVYPGFPQHGASLDAMLAFLHERVGPGAEKYVREQKA